MLLNKENSILVVIDVQEKLAPGMHETRLVIKNCARLLNVSRIFGIPAVITEQSPDRLGPSMIDIREAAGNTQTISKTTFSCAGNGDFMNILKKSGRQKVVLAGIELHVCVLQTALELKERGYDVSVVLDACSSRKEKDVEIALHRILQNGISVLSYETLVFEWLKDAGAEEFSNITENHIDRN